MVLVGYWSFDNDVLDRSGNGLNGTLTGGATYVTGIRNAGLSFVDLSTWNVQVTHNALLNFGASGTHAVSFWLYLRTAPSATRTILCKGNNSGVSERAPGIFVSSTRNVLYRKSTSATTQDGVQTATALTLNTWYNVVCQFDTAVGMQIYLNNISDITPSLKSAMLTNSQNLRIGKDVNGNGSIGTPDAIFDEVRLYNNTLTTDERTQIYLNGLQKLAGTTAKATVLRGNYNSDMLRANCKNNALRANCKVSM